MARTLRALRALRTMGHISEAAGRLRLTGLGLRSLRDGRRFTVTKGDRRHLWFDAHGSRPLPRAYYDSKTVTMWTPEEAAAQSERQRWPVFTPFPHLGFRPEALTELAARTDRDLYNLPDRIDDPRQVGAPLGHLLPLYVLRAHDRSGRVRHLAYSDAGRSCDETLSETIAGTPAIVAQLDSEDRTGRASSDEKNIQRWLDDAGLADQKPVLRRGAWEVTLPASAFGRKPLTVTKVGSFVMRGNTILRVRTDDLDLRRRALVERMALYLGSRSKERTDRTTVEGVLAVIARQLELDDMDLAALRDLVSGSKDGTLATQLTRL